MRPHQFPTRAYFSALPFYRPYQFPACRVCRFYLFAPLPVYHLPFYQFYHFSSLVGGAVLHPYQVSALPVITFYHFFAPLSVVPFYHFYQFYHFWAAFRLRRFHSYQFPVFPVITFFTILCAPYRLYNFAISQLCHFSALVGFTILGLVSF